ncbi:MAG: 4Fe-4S dicluster domain-containing protein [Candidatus Nezhaarchaeota archaeon]|nr:4Fe-4S dicluster domain-containing protein [Candidatus Nezhaarchaeota archaeon]
MGLKLVFDPDRCTGCRNCEAACSLKHYGEANYSKSFIRHVFDPAVGTFQAILCLHCEEPICAASCISKAIEKDEAGIVRINTVKCVGCRSCVYACPLSAPFFDEFLRASVKCDLCNGDPECVKFCSSGALRAYPREAAIELRRRIYG